MRITENKMNTIMENEAEPVIFQIFFGGWGIFTGSLLDFQ